MPKFNGLEARAPDIIITFDISTSLDMTGDSYLLR